MIIIELKIERKLHTVNPLYKSEGENEYSFKGVVDAIILKHDISAFKCCARIDYNFIAKQITIRILEIFINCDERVKDINSKIKTQVHNS